MHKQIIRLAIAAIVLVMSGCSKNTDGSISQVSEASFTESSSEFSSEETAEALEIQDISSEESIEADCTIPYELRCPSINDYIPNPAVSKNNSKNN